MADKLPIDYWAIEQEIANVLSDNLVEDGFTIEVERELMFSAEQTPWVCIYMDRRDAPPDRQTINAGRRILYRIRFIIWVAAYALSRELSIESCVRATAKVEAVLLRNRKFRDIVDMSWMTGGFLASSRVQGGTGSDFLALSEIVLNVETELVV